MSWDRILALQSLQREDVLREFLDKQQDLAQPAASSPTPPVTPASSQSVPQRAG
jgi:hypothetical protein